MFRGLDQYKPFHKQQVLPGIANFLPAHETVLFLQSFLSMWYSYVARRVYVHPVIAVRNRKGWPYKWKRNGSANSLPACRIAGQKRL